METFRGFKIKNRKGMTHWEALLEEWLLANERYCRMMKGYDAPFAYTERAQIGLLAAAAWRCGRVALEEFQHPKKSPGRKWNGRCDLYMASDDMEELIEAKMIRLALRSNSFIEQIAATLRSARGDAKCTKSTDESVKCIGVAFIVATFPISMKENIDEAIEQAIQALKNANHHALAWCFPKEYRHSENEETQLLPGVFMVAANTAHYEEK